MLEEIAFLLFFVQGCNFWRKNLCKTLNLITRQCNPYFSFLLKDNLLSHSLVRCTYYEWMVHRFIERLVPPSCIIFIALTLKFEVLFHKKIIKLMTGWQKLSPQTMCRSYIKYNAIMTRNVAYYITTGLCLVRATRKKNFHGVFWNFSLL